MDCGLPQQTPNSYTIVAKISGRKLVSWPASLHINRLAANKHSTTDPDVTAVTVMLIRLLTAVERSYSVMGALIVLSARLASAERLILAAH
jgi:hypothetical protein